MGIFDGVVKLIGATGNITTSVTARGSKGAVAVEILDASGNQITNFFSGGSVGVLNASDVRVNPATNEGLDSILSAIQSGISIKNASDVVVNPATAENQVTGNASLASILTAVDGLETLITATNAAVDGVEALLTTIDADTSAINSFTLPSGLRPVAFDSFTGVTVTSVTGANQQVIAQPGASKQIWVYGWVLTATAAGTIAFQDEDDTVFTGAMTVTTASGSAPMSQNLLMPLIKVPTNKALELDVVTATVNGRIYYAIVSV